MSMGFGYQHAPANMMYRLNPPCRLDTHKVHTVPTAEIATSYIHTRALQASNESPNHRCMYNQQTLASPPFLLFFA